MLITLLVLLLVSNAVSLRRDKSVLYSRVVIIGLLYSAFLSFNNLYLKSIATGVGIYGGVFNVTTFSLLFNIFMFLISAIILILTAFYPKKVIITKIKEFSSLFSLLSHEFRYNEDVISNKTAEQFRIIVFVLSGAAFLTSAVYLIFTFLSIELQSYGLCITMIMLFTVNIIAISSINYKFSKKNPGLIFKPLLIWLMALIFQLLIFAYDFYLQNSYCLFGICIKFIILAFTILIVKFLMCKVLNKIKSIKIALNKQDKAIPNWAYYYIVTLVTCLMIINFRIIPKFILTSTSLWYLYPLQAGLCAVIVYYIKRHLHKEPNVKKEHLVIIFIIGILVNIATALILPFIWDAIPEILHVLPDVVDNKNLKEVVSNVASIIAGLLYSKQNMYGITTDKISIRDTRERLEVNPGAEQFHYRDILPIERPIIYDRIKELDPEGFEQWKIDRSHETFPVRGNYPPTNPLNVDPSGSHPDVLLEYEYNISRSYSRCSSGVHRLNSIIRMVNELPINTKNRSEILVRLATRDKYITSNHLRDAIVRPNGTITTVLSWYSEIFTLYPYRISHINLDPGCLPTFELLNQKFSQVIKSGYFLERTLDHFLHYSKEMKAVMPADLKGQQRLNFILDNFNMQAMPFQERAVCCWVIASVDPDITTDQLHGLELTSSGIVIADGVYTDISNPPIRYHKRYNHIVAKMIYFNLFKDPEHPTNLTLNCQLKRPSKNVNLTLILHPELNTSRAIEYRFFPAKKWLNIGTILRQTSENIHAARERQIFKNKQMFGSRQMIGNKQLGIISSLSTPPHNITYEELISKAHLSISQKIHLSRWVLNFHRSRSLSIDFYNDRKQWSEMQLLGKKIKKI